MGAFFVLVTESDGHQRRSAQAYQEGKRRNQGDDGTAHAHTGQRQITYMGNVADVHPVHNAVEYIDELGQHRGNGQFEHQFSNGISAQIVGL